MIVGFSSGEDTGVLLVMECSWEAGAATNALEALETGVVTGVWELMVTAAALEVGAGKLDRSFATGDFVGIQATFGELGGVGAFDECLEGDEIGFPKENVSS